MIKTLVLPAYNEEKYIGDIVNRSKNYVDRVIVVDNCSTDKTFSEAKKAGAITLKHCVNLGKGASLKTGCDAAINIGTDIIALMDSDGQHKPEDLPEFFDALDFEKVNMVIGCRISRHKMPLIRSFGTKLLMLFTRILYGLNANDIQSGFRVINANIYHKLKPISNNYFADAEMTIRAGINNFKFKEIEIETIYIDKYKGATLFDGIGLLFNILKWRFIL